MRRAGFVPWLAGLLPARAAAPLAAQRPPGEGGGPASLRIDFVEDSLPNGLKVLYHVDRSTPVVAVNVWYDVGSKSEAEGRTGFAHLFEHVMFKGSQNVADGQHWSLLEAAGGRAGADINGTTWTDRTNYFETVPSNQVELALWLESDRMGTLTRTLTKEKLDNQREVVKNERRQSVDNQPYGSWFDSTVYHAFPEGHPYAHGVIGSMEDLSAASVEDVTQFFRTYYAPNNAVLVVAGDIDVPQVRELVRRHFGWIPRGPAAPPVRRVEVPPLIGREQRIVIEDGDAPAPAVYVSYRVPGAREQGSYVASLLAAMLAEGRAAALYSTLVREQSVAAQVFGGTFGLLEDADVMFFGVTGKPGGDAQALEAAVRSALDEAPGRLTAEDLERVRAGVRYGFVNGLQTLGGFGGRADALAQGWTYYRDPNWATTYLDRLQAVTLDQVRALAGERMVSDNRLTLVYVPVSKSSDSRQEVPR